MLDESRSSHRGADSHRRYRVFRARREDGSLTLHELDAGSAGRIYRRWLTHLDEKAAKLTLGKPSDDVARRVLELAENFLRQGDMPRAARAIRLVADSELFDGTQEHALAAAALKNLRPHRRKG